MARLPRVVVTDIAHHVTQRGNARQAIFASDTDRLTYLELLGQHCELYHLSPLGYCLMSNHVHLIVVPRTGTSLAQALKHTHGRYAAYWNARQHSSGHVWGLAQPLLSDLPPGGTLPLSLRSLERQGGNFLDDDRRLALFHRLRERGVLTQTSNTRGISLANRFFGRDRFRFRFVVNKSTPAHVKRFAVIGNDDRHILRHRRFRRGRMFRAHPRM